MKRKSRCAHCGDWFEHSRSDARYCPDKSCRKAASEERARQEEQDREGLDAIRATLTKLSDEERGVDSSRRSTGRLRECRCNSAHVLDYDEDDWPHCLKCGGAIDGEAIAGRIHRELRAGKVAGEVAARLNAERVPVSFAPTWDAAGVERVAGGSIVLPSAPPLRVVRPDKEVLEAIRGEEQRWRPRRPEVQWSSQAKGTTQERRAGMLIPDWEGDKRNELTSTNTQKGKRR